MIVFGLSKTFKNNKQAKKKYKIFRDKKLKKFKSKNKQPVY